MSNDADWIKFFAITDYVYRVKAAQQGTNVDVALQVYFEEADGSLTDMSGEIDDFGAGLGVEEAYDLNTPPFPGTYFARIWTAAPQVWGAGSDYDLSVQVLIGGGHLILVAVDKLNNTQPPAGAKVIINNTTTQSFATTSLSLTGLAAGVHTIRVVTADGYLPEEDPALPNQAANPDSVLYGNPKRKTVVNDTWQSVVFQFVPYARVQTNTLVRNQWTGERLTNVPISFRARSGIISNLVYNGYPNSSTYKTSWVTRADGTFPTNVLLPTVSYDLTLAPPGYTATTRVNVVTNPLAGQVLDLGTFYLRPLDTNNNGIADAWEWAQFGSMTNFPSADGDGDGCSNSNEYRAGSDATNRGSYFKGNRLQRGTNGLTLNWPVSPGRQYQVGRAEQAGRPWTTHAGPWEALAGQTNMTWTDTNAPPATSRVFRIELLLP